MKRCSFARLFVSSGVLSLIVLSSPVQAGQPVENTSVTELDTNPVTPWTVRIEPAAWNPAPSGDISIPGGSNKMSVENLNIDSTRIAPAGEIHLQKDRWRLSFSGFGFSIDQTASASAGDRFGGVTLAAGDAIKTDLNFSSFEATVSYALYHKAMRPLDTGGHALDATLFVVGGLRMYDVEIDVSLGPAGIQRSADHQFFEPIAGLKGEMELYDKFTIDLQATVGGFSTGSDTNSASFDVIVGFTWRPVDWVGAQFGYRLLVFDLEDGDSANRFKYRGSLAGIYGGVVVRF